MLWGFGICDFGFLDFGFVICDSGFWNVGFWNLGVLDFGMLDFGNLDFGSQQKNGVTWQRSTMVPGPKVYNDSCQSSLQGRPSQTLSS